MSSLIKNTVFGFRYKKWPLSQAFAYFAKGTARELHICPKFWENNYFNVCIRLLKKKWLMHDENTTYFDIKGAKLPDISNNEEKMKTLISVFEDTFLISAYHHENYNKLFVEKMDNVMMEGPYGYTDNKFDVTVKKGDIVIDIGAWIGDFSAYAASKGAIVYAFEPVKETCDYLFKTAKLNGNNIYPVQKGLSNIEREAFITIDESSGNNSMILERSSHTETISLTTLDKFVEENKLEHLDFIKADIEGAERDMLRGATNILKTFSPKLAICTYHLLDDPEVLEQIIKEANPDYKVVHLKNKLFAMVVK